VLVDDQHRPPVAGQQRLPAHHRGRQDRAGVLAALRPGDLPRRRPRLGDRGQLGADHRLQHPAARRVRYHRPKHGRLITQHGDVAQALATVGDHHRESVNTRPGSCSVCGATRPANTADNCAVNVVASARSASSRDPHARPPRHRQQTL
jgi:hypothetical protein